MFNRRKIAFSCFFLCAIGLGWSTQTSAEQADADAATVTMRGEIRLNDRWAPFEAVETLAPRAGFEWRATVKMGLLAVRGFDRYEAHFGEMRWKMLGVLPVAKARGSHIARSARGRLAAEGMWVPTALTPA